MKTQSGLDVVDWLMISFLLTRYGHIYLPQWWWIMLWCIFGLTVLITAIIRDSK